MKREHLPDVIIVILVVALFTLFFWTQESPRREATQGKKQHQRMIVEEIQKIETEQKQAGWQTSLQDLDPTH